MGDIGAIFEVKKLLAENRAVTWFSAAPPRRLCYKHAHCVTCEGGQVARARSKAADGAVKGKGQGVGPGAQEATSTQGNGQGVGPGAVVPGGLNPAPAVIIPARALLADLVNRYSDGLKWREMVKASGMSGAELHLAIQADKELAAKYRAAREARAHVAADDIDTVTAQVMDGDLDPKRADLRVKYLQWSASKSASYSDRAIVEHQHTHDVQLDTSELTARLGELLQVAAVIPKPAIEGDFTMVSPSADNA